VTSAVRADKSCGDSRDWAMPPDVRKRSALPFRFVMNSGLRPNKLGVAEDSLGKFKGDKT